MRKEAGLCAGPSIPPISTVPHGGQMESFWGKRRGLELLFHQSAWYCMVLRWIIKLVVGRSISRVTAAEAQKVFQNGS